LATWVEIAVCAPAAFALGVLIGFALANRYRLERRDQSNPPQ
jgi:hypothetical protein